MELMVLMLLLLFITVGGLCFLVIALLKDKKKMKRQQDQFNKIQSYYIMMNLWLEMKQKGQSAVIYLQQKGIKHIAIYGMNALGERFYEEIKSTEIEVVCVIDKNPEQVMGNFVVIYPEQKIPEVDAIIVTANYYYQEIANPLKSQVNCPVYSLYDVLANSFRRV